MTIPRLAALLTTASMAVACTRTVIVTTRPQPAPPAREPEEPRERERPRSATAATLGIPPGHLPRAGECRIWHPRVAPGRQRGERSRSCAGIAREAPAGSWVVYRPTRDRRLVYVRVLDRRRPGVIVVVRVFDVESGRFLREEPPEPEPRDERDDRDGPGRVSRPIPRPPADPRRPPEERPRPPEEQPAPPENLPGPARAPKPDRQPPQQQPEPRSPFGERRTPPGAPAPGPVAPLSIPPGHLPPAGECRIWIPGTPPGRQPHRASGDCQVIGRDAPAGSWVVYRPTADRKVVHVRVVDSQRPGVLVIVRVFDAESGRFLREERP